MPWNGLGTYELPSAYSPEVNGTTIDADRYNGLTDDVAVGITASLNKNGENSPTADINWGAQKLINLAPGTAGGDALAFNQAPPNFSSSINASATLKVTNANAGVNAAAVFNATNGVYNAPMLMTGANFTGIPIAGANAGMFYSDGPGGLVLAASHASGSIRFAAGGLTLQFHLDPDNNTYLTGNLNTTIAHHTENLGTGTSAATGLLAKNNNTNLLQLLLTGSGYTAYPLAGANAGLLISDGTGGLVLNAAHASGIIKFAAGGSTEQMQLNAAGQLLLGTTTVGIGTSAATVLSLANGTATVFGSLKATGGEELLLGVSAGAVYAGAFSNNPFALRTNNVDRMTFAAASMDITAQGVALTRFKATATIRNNTSTFADDPDLTITSLPIGTYAVEIGLFWQVGNSGGADGRKYQLTFSGTQTIAAGFWLDNDNTFNSLSSSTNNGFLTGSGVSAQTTGIFGWTLAKGTVKVTVAGALTLQWAQQVAGVHNLTILAGSYLKATKVG